MPLAHAVATPSCFTARAAGCVGAAAAAISCRRCILLAATALPCSSVPCRSCCRGGWPAAGAAAGGPTAVLAGQRCLVRRCLLKQHEEARRGVGELRAFLGVAPAPARAGVVQVLPGAQVGGRQGVGSHPHEPAPCRADGSAQPRVTTARIQNAALVACALPWIDRHTLQHGPWATSTHRHVRARQRQRPLCQLGGQLRCGEEAQHACQAVASVPQESGVLLRKVGAHSAARLQGTDLRCQRCRTLGGLQRGGQRQACTQPIIAAWFLDSALMSVASCRTAGKEVGICESAVHSGATCRPGQLLFSRNAPLCAPASSPCLYRSS